MVNILIVDDHPIVRQGLRLILSDLDVVVKYDEAGSSSEMIKMLHQKQYDIILLDINLPDRSGIDSLPDLQNTQPDTPVLILSMYPEKQYAIRAMKAGASGYLTKEGATEELINAVNKILDGGKYISPTMAESFMELLDQENMAKHTLLSDREYEVMLYIARGISIKEMADRLNLSEKTISTYRSRILEKMEFKSNAEIIKYSLQEKLID